MASLPFSDEAVRALANILTETGLSEIEIEGKEGRIRVARALTAATVAVAAPAPVAAATPVAAAPVAAPPAAATDDAHHPGAIPSPMVGIAYLAPEPGAAQFVQVGQSVTAGQTLMLIEAMKTFNQIKAPKAGTILRILVAPGEPVEFGQPLMILD